MKVNTLKHYILHSHIQLYIHVHVFAQKFPNSRKLCLHVLKLVYSENTLKTHLYIEFKISLATLCAHKLTCFSFWDDSCPFCSPVYSPLLPRVLYWHLVGTKQELGHSESYFCNEIVLVYQLQNKPLYIQENSHLVKMKIKNPTLV